ncbi:protein of unknown function [Tepidibacter aestuarii]|nr:protein of unknown function [Tepidibacter aestuarii]
MDIISICNEPLLIKFNRVYKYVEMYITLIKKYLELIEVNCTINKCGFL